MSLTFAVVFFGTIGLVGHAAFSGNEVRRARLHFESFHGEPMDWLSVRGCSGAFIAETIRLECARIETKERTRREAMVHLYHPLTPFSWFCGDRSDGGRGDSGSLPGVIACPLCVVMRPRYDLLVESRRTTSLRALGG